VEREGRRWFAALIVLVGGVIPFLPILQNGFINWDDERWLIENPWHQAPLATRLATSWWTPFLQAYMPVTLMTFALDRALWGLEPAGYHATSLVLHAATALAVYLLARQLIGLTLALDGQARRSAIEAGAAVAALVFAAHPLRAEPVSWVSARDTVLGGLLLVLATVAYLEGCKRGRAGEVKSCWYRGSVLLFALALLARSTGLVLPGVLVLLDIYPLRRLGGVTGWTGPAARRVWLEKVPFVALAAGIVPITFWARAGQLVFPLDGSWSALHAGAAAVYSTGWSVAALIAPINLSIVYDMPSRARPAGYLAASLAVSVLTAFGVARRNRWPSVLTALAAFGVLLLPMSGAIPGGRIAGPHDRYTYLPGVVGGLLAGGGAAFVWARCRMGELSQRTLVAVALVALAVFGTWGVLTWRQCGVWSDSLLLWRRAVRIAPRNAVARQLLGHTLGREGDLEGALEQYREVARLWPTSAGAKTQVGYALLALGRWSEAETVLSEAAEAAPADSWTRLGLGRVLMTRGAVSEALVQLRLALQNNSRSPDIHLALGQALAQAGRTDEAREHIRQTLALRPGWKAAETLRATLEQMKPDAMPTGSRP
jgi:protein O-mannosyl-transferase